MGLNNGKRTLEQILTEKDSDLLTEYIAPKKPGPKWKGEKYKCIYIRQPQEKRWGTDRPQNKVIKSMYILGKKKYRIEDCPKFIFAKNLDDACDKLLQTVRVIEVGKE